MIKRRTNITIFIIAIYCALMPLENVLDASLGGSVNKYVGLLAILLIFLKQLKVCELSINKYKHLPLMLFCLLCLTSYLWRFQDSGSVYRSIIFNMTVFTIILLQYPLTYKDRRDIFHFCIFVGIVLSIMIILGRGIATASNTLDARSTIIIAGNAADENNLAVSIGITALMALFLGIQSNKKIKKILYFLLVLIILLAILFTGSRGGLLAFIVGAAVLIYKLNDGIKPSKIIGISVLFVILGFISQFFLSKDMLTRFSVASVIEGKGTGRFTIWGNALKIFGESSLFRQLFGYGIGAFSKVYGSYHVLAYAAHNDLFEVLIDLGILGLIVYLILLIRLYKISKSDPMKLALLSMVLAASMSMEQLVKKMFWLAIYFVLVTTYDEEESINECTVC